MDSKPQGKVTFLFTDIEGSTKLAQAFPDTLNSALQKHNSILYKIIESNNGFVFKTIGDAFCCAFQNPSEAVNAAVEIQKEMQSAEWNEAPPVKIRIGLHSGIAEWNGKDYMGYVTLARASRVMSSAYGEQIILTDNVYASVKDNLLKEISFRDLGERRLKDLIHPVRLYQINAAGLREEFPPLKTLDSRPNNLPVQLTSFIGREEEMKEIKKLLEQTHLLTLTGTGGTGKTRLAFQIAADVIDEFENGIWVAELSAISDPEFLPQTVAKALGIQELPNQKTEETLIDFLKEKEALLILDNCEHIIDAAAELTENILSKSQKIKIIATSREALRCSGEKTHQTLSLESPDPGKNESPEQLTQYEAVRLFIERALAVNSNFRVNNENAPALAGICSHLDGIPLAIELAAARTRILKVEKIYERLEDRFKLLTGGKRTALPRQQTLKALIDWSYDLLKEKEKVLFQRLSVFSGGWTLEACEEICADEVIEDFELMDILTELSNKSLVVSKDVSGNVRFFLLETLKQYAAEKLTEDSELRKRHFQYFRKTADQERLRSGKIYQIEWLSQIETELDNIRSAINWSSEYDKNECFSLLNDMTEFWNTKGYYTEAISTLTKALKSGNEVSAENRAQILYSAGMISYGLGKISEAVIYADDSLAISREINFAQGIMNSLNLKGILISVNIDKSKEALIYYEECLQIAREIKSKETIASVLYNSSFPLHRLGNFELAMQRKREALEIYKEMKNIHRIANSLANLAVIENNLNNFESAKIYSEESLSESYKINDKFLISANLVILGSVYKNLKDYPNALKLMLESISISKEFGYNTNLIPSYLYLGDVYYAVKDYENAFKYYRKSVLKGIDTGIDYFLYNNLYGFSRVYYEQKDYEKAVMNLAFVKSILDNSGISFNKYMKSMDETYESRLREAAGKEEFERIFEKGMNFSREETLNYTKENI